MKKMYMILNVGLLMSTGHIFAAELAKTALDSKSSKLQYVGDINLDVKIDIKTQKINSNSSCYEDVDATVIVQDGSTSTILFGDCTITEADKVIMGSTGDRVQIDTSKLEKIKLGRVMTSSVPQSFVLPGVNTDGKLFSFIPSNPKLAFLTGAEAQVVIQTADLTAALAQKEGKDWAPNQVLVSFLVRTDTNPDKQQDGPKVFEEAMSTVVSKADAARAVWAIFDKDGDALFTFLAHEPQNVSFVFNALLMPN